MRQYHARQHFGRVDLIDMRRQQIINDYRARWTGSILPAVETPRFRRLCRIVSMYRVAGYLSPQEI